MMALCCAHWSFVDSYDVFLIDVKLARHPLYHSRAGSNSSARSEIWHVHVFPLVLETTK